MVESEKGNHGTRQLQFPPVNVYGKSCGLYIYTTMALDAPSSLRTDNSHLEWSILILQRVPTRSHQIATAAACLEICRLTFSRMVFIVPTIKTRSFMASFHMRWTWLGFLLDHGACLSHEDHDNITWKFTPLVMPLLPSCKSKPASAAHEISSTECWISKGTLWPCKNPPWRSVTCAARYPLSHFLIQRLAKLYTFIILQWKPLKHLRQMAATYVLFSTMPSLRIHIGTKAIALIWRLIESLECQAPIKIFFPTE